MRFHLGFTRHVLGFLEAAVPHLRFLTQLPGPGGKLSESLAHGFYYGGAGGLIVEDGVERAALVGVDMQVRGSSGCLRYIQIIDYIKLCRFMISGFECF